MPEYQVFARKYRPQTFREVFGQEAVVTTLKNAIQRSSFAHAYLFCGARGTGKTTLARVFAKALNCMHPEPDGEPCNRCASCKEITAGSSMDVMEIDGASHRGIDDIRQINENVGYTPAYGKYKIYIIDEVHMLTKEAFNALLKTLEEPPPKVLFFFATTEPHKVLSTIISRCQRFNLRRLAVSSIVGKLKKIAVDAQIDVEEGALRLLAAHAEGGMRDAESLFDQIVSFHAGFGEGSGKGAITTKTVTEILGLVPRSALFAFDQAGKEGRLSAAFDLAEQLFVEGKDIGYFLESLTEHYRNILLVKIAGKDSVLLTASEEDRGFYSASAALYSQEQCLTMIDMLMEAQRQSFAPFGKIALEALLLRLLRIHQRIPVDLLVQRLSEIEQRVASPSQLLPREASPVAAPSIVSRPATAPLEAKSAVPAKKDKPTDESLQPARSSFLAGPAEVKLGSLTEDPTPTLRDFGKRKESFQVMTPLPVAPAVPAPSVLAPSIEPSSVELGARPTEEARLEKRQQQSRLDTLLQFASVELEGRVKKK